MYESRVTLECNPSRWIAGNSVTRYRYILYVHTSKHVVGYSGRGMFTNSNEVLRVGVHDLWTYRALSQSPVPRGVP